MTEIDRTRYKDFDALVARHQGLIRSLCWRAADGDGALCADLMQEVVCQLWRSRYRLRAGASEGEVREWVRLHCRSVVSHQRRRNVLPLAPLDEAAEVAAQVDHREQLEELTAGLTDQEYQLLKLLIDGYQQVEIAAMWDMHPDSVGRLKRQMIEKMKKNI